MHGLERALDSEQQSVGEKDRQRRISIAKGRRGVIRQQRTHCEKKGERLGQTTIVGEVADHGKTDQIR